MCKKSYIYPGGVVISDRYIIETSDAMFNSLTLLYFQGILTMPQYQGCIKSLSSWVIDKKIERDNNAGGRE